MSECVCGEGGWGGEWGVSVCVRGVGVRGGGWGVY